LAAVHFFGGLSHLGIEIVWRGEPIQIDDVPEEVAEKLIGAASA